MFRDTLSRDTLSRGTLSRDTLSRGTLSRDTLSRGTLSRNTMSRDTEQGHSIMSPIFYTLHMKSELPEHRVMKSDLEPLRL
jgi:hypothetical protein